MRWYRLPSFEDHENPEPEAQDVELRRLVDLLPPVQRHLISRTFFGGVFLSVAARELGLEKRAARTLRDEGLAQLQAWFEDPPEEDPPLDVEVRVDALIWRCAAEHARWGACQQPAMQGKDLCSFHFEVTRDGLTPNPDYERAVVEGRREPVQARLTKSEMEALVSGRYRGDGRRLDQFCVADPIEVGEGWGA